MTRSRYRIFEDEHSYFLTCTVVAWLPVFARPNCVEISFDSWRFLQKERGVRIFGYVILENHLHWIASGHDLSDQVSRFKSYTAIVVRASGLHRPLQARTPAPQAHAVAGLLPVPQASLGTRVSPAGL
jgi:REP element-mobilizing transposase RayT